MFNKSIKTRASRPLEGRRSKISEKNIRTQKKTALHKKGIILNSTKGLNWYLSSPFLPLNGWHSREQFGLILSVLNLLIPKSPPKITKNGTKAREGGDCEIVPKSFDSIYSVINARLKTSNNEHLIDLILILLELNWVSQTTSYKIIEIRKNL